MSDDALNEAMEKAQAQLDGEAGVEAPAEPAEVVEAPAEAAPAETEAQAAQRARDEEGKFTKTPKPRASKKPAAAAPSGVVHGAAPAVPPAGQGTAAGAAPPPAPAADPAAPALKPPSSLRPAAKEAFAKAPREVQEDLVRIDREVRQVMQRSAEATKIAEAAQRTIAPFEGLARANGMDAMSYAGSVLQTAAQLFQGPMQARPGMMATILQQAGLNTEEGLAAVSAALQGQPPRPDQQRPPLTEADVERIADAKAEQRLAAVQQQRTIDDFLAKPPDHLDAIMPQFIKLVGAESKVRNLSTQDLYDLADAAKWATPEVRENLMSSKLAEQARTRTAAAAQAKAAAVSIRSRSAAPMSGAKPKGLDAAMEAAREKLGL